MLILTRKCDQSITIARDVQIKVVRIVGKSVKLAITCPKDITIRRVTGPHSIPQARTESFKESASDS